MRYALRSSIGVMVALFVLGFTPMLSYADPDTSITSTPSNPSNSSGASFSFTSTEADSTFECQIDGVDFTPCTSPQDYTGLAEGAHSFSVRAIYPIGNPDPTPATYSWTVDTTPPDTSITSTPSNPSNSSDASFSFTSTETGSTFECQLDGDGFGVCTSPKGYSDLSEGTHTFEVRAIDVLGNSDLSPASFSWTIDAVAPYTTLNGNWMVNIRGPNNDKGAAHITFDGPNISGYGFLFSLGQAFSIEQGSEVAIDYTNRKIEGSFKIESSETSTTLGQVTILKGTFNKKLGKLTLKAEFDKEGVIPPVRMTFSGYRFDPADPDIIQVPDGFTVNATIKGRDVEGHPLTVIVEPSSLGDRLGILSGGGYCKYNELPFELSISESIFFITDKGQIYGEFNSNLFSTVTRGRVTSSQRGPKFQFDPLLTFYAKRATVKGFAEEDIPTPPTLVSPENQATNLPINPTFTWTPSVDESVTYGLQVSTSSTFSSTAVNQSGLTGTSYNATGLTINRKHYWRMNTTKSGVVSDWSTVWNFTTSTGI